MSSALLLPVHHPLHSRRPVPALPTPLRLFSRLHPSRHHHVPPPYPPVCAGSPPWAQRRRPHFVVFLGNAKKVFFIFTDGATRILSKSCCLRRREGAAPPPATLPCPRTADPPAPGPTIRRQSADTDTRPYIARSRPPTAPSAVDNARSSAATAQPPSRSHPSRKTLA